MKIEDILTLAKAGFTAEQISQLSNTAPEVQPQTPPTSPAPAPAVEEKPATPPQAMDFSEIMQRLDTLTNAIQANGIANSNQPQPSTVDDILASIINPPTNNK
jgi:hypothetical protein